MKPAFEFRTLVLTLATSLVLVACGRDAVPPTIVLISLDGFRWDYVDRPEATTFQALARDGVRSEGLIPIFPSKTFPNHYTIVTGLYPEHHGLVANNMYDPESGAWYALADREAVQHPRWYGGEPIWVAAERAGQPTAPVFWPGSEAPIGGVEPSHWEPYDHDASPRAIIERLLALLDLPGADRPTFITAYFHLTDTVGHDAGTDSPELARALAEVDSAIAMLVEGLEARGLDEEVDLLLVSDHGMASTAADRVIYLDDAIDLDRVTVSDWNPVAAIWPAAGEQESVYQALVDLHPNLAVYWKSEIPTRWQYQDHSRIAPIIAVADEGWSISSRGWAESHPGAFDGATHGYDPALRSMHGLFVARGPSFRRGLTVPPVANIHLYELMMGILQLETAPNDGDLEEIAHVLTPAALRKARGR